MEHMLQFDYTKLKKLQKCYDKAVAKNEKQFTFEGAVLLTDYAKYLLEYLNMAIKK
jgi:hypothetical protein